MKKVRNKHWHSRNLLNRSFKVSSAVLVISTGLMGNHISPNVNAQNVTHVNQQPSLEAYIQQRQAEVKQWRMLTDHQKAQLSSDLSQAKSIDAIDRLLNEVKSTSTQNTRQLEEARVIREQLNNNMDRFFAELNHSGNKVDGGKLNEVNLDTTTSARHLLDELNQKDPKSSDIKTDIQQLLALPNGAMAFDNYVATKTESLKAFEARLAQQPNLSEERKALLSKEIDAIKHQLNTQNDLVLNRLKSSNHKTEAVTSLIRQTFNDREADTILKRVQTKDKTDAQIANQLVSEFDRLSARSSDDVLRSMIDNTSNPQELLEALLSTRYDTVEAAKIASDILKGHPNSAQIVNRLKQRYGPHMTGDDILENVLDQAHDKRQALETILGSQFNDETARALAKRIANKADSRAALLKQLKSDADGRLNDIIKAKNDLDRIKVQIDKMIGFLKGMDGVLNDHLRGEQSHLLNPFGLFDRALSGKSILDRIPDIPNPTQGRALSLIKPSDDFLSGLFDHEGNFDLPAAGRVAKQTLLPFGIALILLGSVVIWFTKRHKSKNS
ncbi:hypothetical protein [Staphylococcus agnetis]|uniref:Cell wall anchor protein n=1 Tax=Staphylococcus agnetis TaxID=985762 RepID=A0ABX3Z0I4_9STAP|nr:hypothetical protein [Staphylococcus agnetis]OSP19099.1 hypothetical protein B9L42_07905 [Staphylococcus agnetis]OSP24290.1 hypothetical protein B9M87_04245 [Staphylococcus agnetis]OTW30024.1 hypothetical protein B9M88_12020 [Staphylococcus agnetis]